MIASKSLHIRDRGDLLVDHRLEALKDGISFLKDYLNGFHHVLILLLDGNSASSFSLFLLRFCFDLFSKLDKDIRVTSEPEGRTWLFEAVPGN